MRLNFIGFPRKLTVGKTIPVESSSFIIRINKDSYGFFEGSSFLRMGFICRISICRDNSRGTSRHRREVVHTLELPPRGGKKRLTYFSRIIFLEVWL